MLLASRVDLPWGGPGWVLLPWSLVVALLTLLPGAADVAAVDPGCLVCGDVGAADAILNVVLFVPLGLALRWSGRGLVAAAGAGVGTSILIELAQTVLPGRFPTLGDVVFNGAGAAVGWLLFGVVARAVRGRTPRTLPVGGTLVAVVAATAWLATPVPPRGILYGQHTPELGGWSLYGGTVRSAAIGPVDVPDGPIPGPAASALARDLDVRVAFEPGPPPTGWAPIFAVASDGQDEALMLAVRDADLMFRVRTRAGALRLREPALVVRDALAASEASGVVSFEATLGSDGWCVEVGGRSRCRLGVSPLEAWAFLVGGEEAVGGAGPLLSILLGAAAVVLLAGSQGTRRLRLLTGAGLLAVLVAAPGVSALAPLSPVTTGLALLCGAGAALVLPAAARRARADGWLPAGPAA